MASGTNPARAGRLSSRPPEAPSLAGGTRAGGQATLPDDLLGAFNLDAAAADLAATAGAGLPGDHTGTFTAVTGRTWASFIAAQPGVAQYITLVERGYALHELVFAILFLTIVAIPLRAGQRWAWWVCWAVLIAYLGYALTFCVHDQAILARSLIGVIALPILLLALLPALARRRAH